MDFNAIVNKLREIEPTDISNPDAEAPKADTKAPVVLGEAAQLRVKAGISTVLEESKKIEEATKKEVKEVVEESTQEEVQKEVVQEQADDGQVEEVVAETKVERKKFDEEVEEILKSSEAKLVKEAKAKPDFLDVDGDGDKKEPMKKAAKDKKKDGGDKKDAPKKGLSAKQKKLPAGLQKAIAKKKGAKTESVVTAKKEVAESMKFLDAIKIVKESNGEMKIEATDTAIWNWAKRVAQSKIGTGDVKEEAYAAKVYESRGGQWDVSRKVISE